MADAGLVQRAYTSITQHFIASGRAPHYTELAKTLSVSMDEARGLQRQAAEATVGCWIAPDTDIVQSWAPFSNIPTHYLLTIEGKQKWYGQ